ncbi:MAG: class I SAM-dependent methyltransferase family protein [Archaeoglobaceae archaeon]|nr:class I SAM-dependent methyltransferase family protein [Archaeoglobaceae archaeon]MCX8152283.1 class I SAM-dependent methyltransferase family protein [Archaeoglobaceae archaeon]MDW8013961.1 class I SAM-dependent methyltransferase family protein [Archaeoglobaceae archaeon]
MKAVKVPRERAEEVRKLVEKLGIKDKNRLIISSGKYVEIPILDGSENILKEFEIVEQKEPIFARKKKIRDYLVEICPEKVEKIRSYKIVGDIILVKIPEELESLKKEIGRALLEIHKNCKAVWLDRGKESMLRRPKLELIAGSGSETIHRENGCLFKLDVTKVMFSAGNKAERMRIARQVSDDEIVVDMFAGIGYFSIPIAVHSKAEKIYAIELNFESYRYLLENIRLNSVKKVVPILGDSMYLTPEGVADRVVMGHIYCQDFLPIAVRALNKEGIIHYHEAVAEAAFFRPIERIRKVCTKMNKKFEILVFKKVKSYSPGVSHVVVDFRVFS